MILTRSSLQISNVSVLMFSLSENICVFTDGRGGLKLSEGQGAEKYNRKGHQLHAEGHQWAKCWQPLHFCNKPWPFTRREEATHYQRWHYIAFYLQTCMFHVLCWICSIFSLVRWQCCVYGLVNLSHKKHLVKNTRLCCPKDGCKIFRPLTEIPSLRCSCWLSLLSILLYTWAGLF